MEKSDILKKLHTIQTEIKVPKANKNTFGGYVFRSAEDILEAIKPFLTETKTIITFEEELKLIHGKLIETTGDSEFSQKQGKEPLKQNKAPNALSETLLPVAEEIQKKESFKQLKEEGRFVIISVATITCIETGQSFSASFPAREPYSKKGMDLSQISGSTASYARKYALGGLLGLSAGDDPDATNTHGKTTTRKTKITPTPSNFPTFNKKEAPEAPEPTVELMPKESTKFDFN